MTTKRAILALLTFLAISRIFFSLNESLTQPQIQSRLELYQTNLVLHVAELKSNREDEPNFTSTIESLVGEAPYSTAVKQYQKAKSEAKISRENFTAQLQQLASIETNNFNQSDRQTNPKAQPVVAVSPQQQLIEQQIIQIDEFIDEIDIKQGILYAAQNKSEKALNLWEQLITRSDNSQNKYNQTAIVLKDLWQLSPQVSDDSQGIINTNLDGWFRYKTLEKLYQVQGNNSNLAILRSQEQQFATKAVIKLSVISSIPVLGGIIGVGILIFLIVQLFIRKEEAILATNSNTTWQTPWNWEITWQVLIVGFFFIGQFAVPFLLGLLGINPTNASLRIKALYVFATYMLMALGGIGVLYISIKSFLPLPKDWFKFKLSNWISWGIGGYLVAIPLVLVISLINQQIWQGQGGSNPLLFLALQAQDKVALSIFFITASIAAPIFEEIMFRGFLLPSMTRYVPVWGAIIISGSIFAISHLSLSEVLPLTTLGIVLGVVYTRSRNLLAPMLLHSLWNSGTLISLFVLGSGI